MLIVRIPLEHAFLRWHPLTVNEIILAVWIALGWSMMAAGPEAARNIRWRSGASKHP